MQNHEKSRNSLPANDPIEQLLQQAADPNLNILIAMANVCRKGHGEVYNVLRNLPTSGEHFREARQKARFRDTSSDLEDLFRLLRLAAESGSYATTLNCLNKIDATLRKLPPVNRVKIWSFIQQRDIGGNFSFMLNRLENLAV